MNNKISVFENAEFGSVRAMTINDEPWFVGKDVAMVLGYTNPAKAIRAHVDDEDKGVNEMDTPSLETKYRCVVKRDGVYGETQYRAVTKRYTPWRYAPF